MTDNASWRKVKDQKNGSVSFEVTVYPQSNEAKAMGLFNGAALYQVPFVLSHEYGHHVFFAHYPQLFSDESNGAARKIADERGLVFNEQTGYDSRLGVFTNGKNFIARLAVRQNYVEATFADAASAVNEGFADLYGYYVSGIKDLTSQLRCFAQNRDISSPAFADGRPHTQPVLSESKRFVAQ